MPRWPALGHEKVADRGVPNWADRVARFEDGSCRPSPRLALSGCPLRTFRQMARVFISFIALLCSTVEFLPFGLDWTHVAEIRFNENKGLPVDNDPPRRQKVRSSTVELCQKLYEI
jgi:hypothetical protein